MAGRLQLPVLIQQQLELRLPSHYCHANPVCVERIVITCFAEVQCRLSYLSEMCLHRHIWSRTAPDTLCKCRLPVAVAGSQVNQSFEVGLPRPSPYHQLSKEDHQGFKTPKLIILEQKTGIIHFLSRTEGQVENKSSPCTYPQPLCPCRSSFFVCIAGNCTVPSVP